MNVVHDTLARGAAEAVHRAMVRLPRLQVPGAMQVSFESLDREDKVRLVEGAVLVDRAYLDLLVNRADDQLQATAALALYGVHELVHIAQGMDDKRRVRALRRSGGEEVLMHLDLHADHLAAATLAAAMPSWSLLWLKEVQCASLHDFPILGEHGSSAARRKELRALSVQCGVACRRIGLSGVHDDGYVYVVHGDSDDAMLLFKGAVESVLADTQALRRRDGRLRIRVPGAGWVTGPCRTDLRGTMDGPMSRRRSPDAHDSRDPLVAVACAQGAHEV